MDQKHTKLMKNIVAPKRFFLGKSDTAEISFRVGAGALKRTSVARSVKGCSARKTQKFGQMKKNRPIPRKEGFAYIFYNRF